MDFYFEIDDAVDISEFNIAWERQRTLNGWPPFEFTWNGNHVKASVNSSLVTGPELRKMLNFSLGLLGRRLK